ncbi:MAG: SMI1/KNR4 family protein [Succinivibrionaceae bacterium]|nr:SMI1/KNR4 family protein [Succinivibrionaceae bacterium]MDY6336773.1 SMI1/KNR4 family protein [Succinivibrionaceae bacterium]MDY6376844.1 SMI1/KNR4 family protein [Succinivibrionaceae bacterium]
MISDGLKKIIETFRKQGTMSFLEPATEEQISAFEKENGITFPEEYREWLSFSDGGELFLPAGVQFYGVAHKPLIDVNDDRRPDDSYVAVGGLCDGAPVLFKKGSRKFAVYYPEDGEIYDGFTYEDFYDFLDNLYDLLGMDGEDGGDDWDDDEDGDWDEDGEDDDDDKDER